LRLRLTLLSQRPKLIRLSRTHSSDPITAHSRAVPLLAVTRRRPPRRTHPATAAGIRPRLHGRYPTIPDKRRALTRAFRPLTLRRHPRTHRRLPITVIAA